MCRVCAGNDPETAKTNFIKRITELGGKVVGEYERNNIPVECICPNGHKCKPRPDSIQQGGGMCRVCAGTDPETAKNNFIKRITELGGKVLGEYEKSNITVDCLCPNGHPCRPRPDKIQQGGGMCKICTCNDPDTARTNFIKRITELGGTVVGEYRGKDKPVDCICPNGHPCRPRPGNIRKGQGMCRRCRQSGGEMFISRVLEKLNIYYETEVYNINIQNKYRYDFQFNYKDKTYYLEFDGIQHFDYIPFFHRDSYDHFLLRREIDIYKNSIAKQSNIKIIRVSYLQIIGVSIEEFSIHLKDLLDTSTSDIIVDEEFYSDWVYREPDMSIIDSIDIDSINDDDCIEFEDSDEESSEVDDKTINSNDDSLSLHLYSLSV